MSGYSVKKIYKILQTLYPNEKLFASLKFLTSNINLLKYAHENGCPWDLGTCTIAPYYGHLDCLKYAHENGCPWDKDTCFDAAKNGNLDCLKYVHENGCPYNKSILLKNGYNTRTLEYIKKKMK